MLTKEAIVQMLKTDKRAVARALVVLHSRQTNDEQAQEGTRYLNGRGFRPCHARMGSSMAKQFSKLGFLSEKQINYWRATDRAGNMRIGIYWSQLLEEAELKAKQKAEKEQMQAAFAAQNFPPVIIPHYAPEPTKEQVQNMVTLNNAMTERDFGNDMERRMVLEEQYGDVLDSDDEKLYGPLKDEMDEIDAFWAKIREKK